VTDLEGQARELLAQLRDAHMWNRPQEPIVVEALRRVRAEALELAEAGSDQVFENWLRAISKGSPPTTTDVRFYREVVGSAIRALAAEAQK
jgi:hypothetical protein